MTVYRALQPELGGTPAHISRPVVEAGRDCLRGRSFSAPPLSLCMPRGTQFPRLRCLAWPATATQDRQHLHDQDTLANWWRVAASRFRGLERLYPLEGQCNHSQVSEQSRSPPCRPTRQRDFLQINPSTPKRSGVQQRNTSTAMKSGKPKPSVWAWEGKRHSVIRLRGNRRRALPSVVEFASPKSATRAKAMGWTFAQKPMSLTTVGPQALSDPVGWAATHAARREG